MRSNKSEDFNDIDIEYLEVYNILYIKNYNNSWKNSSRQKNSFWKRLTFPRLKSFYQTTKALTLKDSTTPIVPIYFIIWHTMENSPSSPYILTIKRIWYGINRISKVSREKQSKTRYRYGLTKRINKDILQYYMLL